MANCIRIKTTKTQSRNCVMPVVMFWHRSSTSAQTYNICWISIR